MKCRQVIHGKNGGDGYRRSRIIAGRMCWNKKTFLPQLRRKAAVVVMKIVPQDAIAGVFIHNDKMNVWLSAGIANRVNILCNRNCRPGTLYYFSYDGACIYCQVNQ